MVFLFIMWTVSYDLATLLSFEIYILGQPLLCSLFPFFNKKTRKKQCGSRSGLLVLVSAFIMIHAYDKTE